MRLSSRVGAIQAIENKLSERRKNCRDAIQSSKSCDPSIIPDINLIVGTSGGSINALFVSLGAPTTAAEGERLSQVWLSINETGLIQPSLRLKLWFGLWFGLLQSLVLTIGTLLSKAFTWTFRMLAKSVLVVIAAEIILAGLVQLEYSDLFLFVLTLIVVAALLAALISRQSMAPNWRLFIVLTIVGGLLSFTGLAAFQGAYSLTVIKFLVSISVLESILVGAIGSSLLLLQRSPVRTQNWWQLSGWAMLSFSIFEFLVTFAWLSFVRYLPVSYNWAAHVMMLMTLPYRQLLPIPIIIGAAMIVLPGVLTCLRVSWAWDARRSWVVGFLTACAIIVASLMLSILFEKEVAPTDSKAIAKTFAEGLPAFYPKFFPPLSGFSVDDKLRAYSQKIIDEKEIKRDLLITASRLPIDSSQMGESGDLPSDLYFYYQAENVNVPEDGNRFISLSLNAPRLLQTIIGSSTIYPIFPPELLSNVEIVGKNGAIRDVQMNIVDGGFIHDSPIEAAQKWGATHIILIESSPKPNRNIPATFSANIGNAFNYLFEQAQNEDTLSRGQTELFELRPTCTSVSIPQHPQPISGCDPGQEWSMDIFDFSRSSLQQAIQQGAKDANDTEPHFIRQAGPPIFRQR